MNGYVNYVAGEIRSNAERGNCFRVTREVKSPPLDACSIDHVAFDPEGTIDLHATVNGERIKEQAIRCGKVLPEEDAREANFRSLWWLNDGDRELVKHLFSSPEGIFRFMASKVLNRFNPEFESFVDHMILRN